jgi:hypothetical protein
VPADSVTTFAISSAWAWSRPGTDARLDSVCEDSVTNSTVPSTAVPSAEPIWRAVLCVPEAWPL